MLKYQAADGRQRWHVIGRHGSPWTPDAARERARELLGEIAKGADPSAEKQAARKAATIAELCDLYLACILPVSCRCGGRPAADSAQCCKEAQHARARQGPDRTAHQAVAR